MDSEPDDPKSARAVEPPRPFLLEVTPEELIVPSTGNLEVKIRNPTEKKCDVFIYFDSFFWLMKIENQNYNNNYGDSKSMCFKRKYLNPKEALTLTIGYHDAKYKTCTHMFNEEFPKNCDKHHGEMVYVPSSKRNNYNYERPEGVLLIRYSYQGDVRICSEICGCANYKIFHDCDERQVDNFPTKRMDLYLKDETEEYKKYREQYAEIRREQARRARWGHVLVNENGVTVKKFKYLDGTIRRLHSFERTNDCEQDIPTDLKQFDALSDEEILKMRKEKKQKFDDEVKEAARKMEEEEEKLNEEFRRENEKLFLMEKEERKKKEEQERIKKEEEEKKEKEKEEAAPAKEKSKVKNDEKSKRPEDPPEKVPTPPKQKSTKSKISVAPPKSDVPSTDKKPVEKVDEKMKDKKPVEKPNVTKNKKKKANPCCVLM